MSFNIPQKLLPVIALLSSCVILNQTHAIDIVTTEYVIRSNNNFTHEDDELYNEDNDNVLSTQGFDSDHRSLISYGDIEHEYPSRVRIPKEQQLHQRIIGGSNVDPNEYPWFARGTFDNHKRWKGCGGSLVTAEFVLSAAHCDWDKNSGFEVGALCAPFGPKRAKNCSQRVQRFDVDKVFNHPGYNKKTEINNDFSLIRLSGRSKITPVKMDMDGISGRYEDGKSLWSPGFGITNDSEDTRNRLKHVKISYVTNEVCKKKYYGRITSAMMCAGGNSKGSCNGDSGGPLYDKKSNTVVGVTSWGKGSGCGPLENYPAVYSRVSSTWKWIKSTICNNHSNPKPEFCLLKPPTLSPVATPTTKPSKVPSSSPEHRPSSKPSDSPSLAPSYAPSKIPSLMPSTSPTESPRPSYLVPSALPSTKAPSKVPSKSPTNNPSSKPSVKPSAEPSVKPSAEPSALPTYDPSLTPTISRSLSPTDSPQSVDTQHKIKCNKSIEDKFKLVILTGINGRVTSWMMKKENSAGRFKVFLEGGMNKEYRKNKLYNEEYCIPKKQCYKFLMFDSSGDGLEYYALVKNGSIVHKSSLNDKRSERIKFGKCDDSN